MENGWSINVGGGFHHCWGNEGGGFCAYADITLTVHFILNHYPHIERVMIIDLDAHQVKKKKSLSLEKLLIFSRYSLVLYYVSTFSSLYSFTLLSHLSIVYTPNDISDLSIFSVVLNGNTFI